MWHLTCFLNWADKWVPQIQKVSQHDHFNSPLYLNTRTIKVLKSYSCQFPIIRPFLNCKMKVKQNNHRSNLYTGYFLNGYNNTVYVNILYHDHHHLWHRNSSVQWISCVQLFATPWTAVWQASLSITNSQSLLKFVSIESVMPSSHLILCHPLLLLLQSFPALGSFQMSQVGIVKILLITIIFKIGRQKIPVEPSESAKAISWVCDQGKRQDFVSTKPIC